MPNHKSTQRKASLVIANSQFKVSAVANKIDQDINFLEEKLEKIQRSLDPNEVIRKTYETMLESRKNVRQWLKTYSGEETEKEDMASINTNQKVT